MRTITSRQNVLVTRMRDARRQSRLDRTLVLLDGARVIREAIRAGLTVETVLVAAPALDCDVDVRALVDACARAGLTVTAGTDRVMTAVSPLRSASAVVALAHPRVATVQEVLATPADGCLFVPVGVQDPGNLGAIIRVAVATAATGVLVDATSADPFGWKAIRGAMGSTFGLPVADVADVTEVLTTAAARGWTVMATRPRDGVSLYKLDLTAPLAIVIGNEGAGLDRTLTGVVDTTVSIPMAGGIDSLNVAVSAGVIAYEARRQRMTA